MNSDTFRKALILTGPTGSGKTEFGLKLAERLGAEIASIFNAGSAGKRL